MLESAFAWWSRRDQDLGREMIRNRISALVLAAATVLATGHGNSSDHANELRIRRALRWMEENPDHTANGEALAALSGLSIARFHVHFKRVTGSSPRDYWQRLRVERAARRLREESSLSITRAAHESGFSSLRYFATAFRRNLGVSPGEHRARDEG